MVLDCEMPYITLQFVGRSDANTMNTRNALWTIELLLILMIFVLWASTILGLPLAVFALYLL